MTVHSSIGASICERYWNCPGSVTLYGHLKSHSTFFAAQGTAAHEIGERYLKLGVPVDTRFLGDTIEVKEPGNSFLITVDAEMLEAVSEYVDYVQGIQLEHSDAILMVEVGFSLKHIDAGAFGTCDAAIHLPSKGRLVVADYKHGAGISVEIADNKQTKYYGLGAYYSLTPEQREAITSVETVIVQPRCPHADGVIRRAIYSVAELLEWEKGLVAAIQRVRSGDETLLAGSHCKFCPGKPHCPEAKNEVARLVELDFKDIATGPPDVKKLTPEQLAHLMGFVPFIKDWCDGLIDHAHILAESGIEIPGYKLADKRANRRWKANATDDLELYLGEQMYAPRKLITPKQAETLLPKGRKHIIDSLWEKPEPGKTLVKVDDSREARLPSAIADFMDIDI